MKIRLRLKSASQPVTFEARASYEKGAFYCVQVGEDVVKYPIADIYSVVEEYGYHAPREVSVPL